LLTISVIPAAAAASCYHTFKRVQEVEALCDMLDFGGPAMVQCAKVKSSQPFRKQTQQAADVL
jgi:hypothetical protein